MGIPCSHAIRIIVNGLREDPQTYAKTFYTLNAFKKTYAQPIMHPNSNIDYSCPLNPDSPPTTDNNDEVSNNGILESDSESDSEDILLAPNTHRQVGRRPNKRKRPMATAPEKRHIQRCGRYKTVGHS